MNPDFPDNSREELEASLTALLLGELPPEQAAQLRRAIEQDAALAALHQRLKLTIDLVRETAVQPAGQTAAQPAPLRLSESRRQQLLAHFKTVTPKEFARPRRHEWRRPVLVAAAAMLVALLALAMFLPALSSSKRKSLAMATAAAKPVPSGARRLGAEGSEAMLERLPGGSQPRPTSAPAQAQAESRKRLMTDRLSARVPEASARPSEGGIESSNISLRDLRGELARSEATGLSPKDRSTEAYYGAGAYGGYSSITQMTFPYGSPELAAAKAEQERISALTARPPGLAAAPPAPKPQPGPVRAPQGESGREPPPSAPAKRTAIVLPGSTAAKETVEQTDAFKSVDARHEEVKVFDLANGGPQDVQQILEDLFQRSGNVRASNNNNRDSMPDAGNPIYQRATQNQPNLGGSVGGVLMQRQTQNRPNPSTPSSGPGNNLAGGGMGGMGGGMMGGGLWPSTRPNGSRGSLGGGMMSGGPTGAPGETSAPPNFALTGITDITGTRQLLFKSGRGEGGVPVPESSELARPALPVGAVALRTAPPAGAAPATPFAGTPLDLAPGQAAASTVPAQDQIPILGDKPLIGRLYRQEIAQSAAEGSLAAKNAEKHENDAEQSAAEEAKLKPRDLSSDLSAAASTGKELTAQGQRVGGVTIWGMQPVAAPGQASPATVSQPVAGVARMGGNLGESEESVKLPRGGTEAQDGAQKRDAQQLAEARTNAMGKYFTYLGAIRLYDHTGEAWTNGIGNYFNDIGGINNMEQLFPQAQAAAERPIQPPLVAANAAAAPAPAQAAAERPIQPPLPAASAEPLAETDQAVRKPPAAPAPIPQPEVQTRENAFSTFSLNVSDVSFKLAAASLEKGLMPEPATVRSEEFINAFDYRDPEAPAGVAVAFACERARYPFAHNRDLLRFSLKTAAQGRQPGRPLNVVLLLDNSGSMERADRVRIIHEALRVLAGQLEPQDKLSVVTFARTARLWVDGVPGSQAGQVAEEVSKLTPQGGTNLEEAMNLAYQTALRHYLANGINRVVLLTDGAANLGNVEPGALKRKAEEHRKQGIALDCFGIGWEGYNDDLLEVLSRNGDGRYGFLNTPEEAASEFAGQLAGALHVAASDVKVQVEFNPARVRAYRQLGYARHQLAKEQFRDNTVNAAQIGAAESGTALYVIETDPQGEGPLGVVRIRYRLPGTGDYREQEWTAPYTGNAAPLEQASPALRLSAVAGAFSEWLVSSPFAAEVTTDRLLGCLRGVPEVYGPDARPRKLEWMIRQAQSLEGK
jgi:Mg-chelatase subunit ChlD